MIHVKHTLCNLEDNMTYSHALSRVGWMDISRVPFLAFLWTETL